MTGDHDRTAITYNGEIYDFKALRQALKSSGRVFRSESDTEVVLHGYQEWGPRVVDRLRGMFAFGIWDGREEHAAPGARSTRHQAALCASDAAVSAVRVGGSRAARLGAGAAAARSDGPRSVPRISVGARAADARRRCRDARAGHLVEAGENGRWRDEPYWDMLRSADRDAAKVTSRDEAKARISSLLDESVAAHLVSDVGRRVPVRRHRLERRRRADARERPSAAHVFGACPNTAFDEVGSRRTRGARRFDASTRTCGSARGRVCWSSSPTRSTAMDHPSGDGINTYRRLARRAATRASRWRCPGSAATSSSAAIRRSAGSTRIGDCSPRPGGTRPDRCGASPRRRSRFGAIVGGGAQEPPPCSKPTARSPRRSR